ncbi:hypothetical protein HNQ77_004173 [Silvibacterium bohemicum]|uniref:Uncharacterized protein n=1 Tax=Silvibacterium bohemicum TaxID=1577686 RepID=A0A841K4X6_9BACT|nr:hypothetical protein [Silvibacterium bohemicum]MBB6146201.1 hypothetical protein [Silvibacterium bohemicum]
MRFVSSLISGGAVASLCIASFAQSAPSPNAPASPADPQAASAPAQTPSPSPANPAPLKLQDLPSDPHTPTADELAEQAAERERFQIRQLAAAQNNWATSATAGVTLELKETGRSKAENGTQITYQLQGKGFTSEMKLSLLRWELNDKVAVVMDGITVNAAGIAVCGGADAGTCGKTMKANEPVVVTATVAKGEAIRIALVAADKKHGAAATLVPFPITAEDKGCKLQVIRGTKNDELVLIVGDGFTSTVNFTAGSESFGEKRPMGAKPNAQGHFVVAMTPWVTGHDNGDTVIYVQNDACSPTLSFHWGKDSYKVE